MRDEMPIRIPPPEVGIVSYLTPNKTDQGLLEWWDTLAGSYTPLDAGAPHPDARQYPNFRLGKQAPMQGDERWVMRTWITDETNPDWFNWANKFAGEDAEFPTFIRTYREPRATYTPRTKGEPLSTLYKLVVTDAGSGYTNGTYPNVVFDDPTVAPTTEATAHGVVAPDGTISECVLDFGGDGYAQDVEFHVESPVNGNPAAGIAYVQPQSAVLTQEEAKEYPEDSPFYAQYLQVVRIYETIPGPTYYETKLDVDGAILTTATTRKFCSDISTGEAINGGTWCKTTKKPTEIDVICEESIECRPIPGNPMESTQIAEDGNVVRKTQTYTATASTVSNEAMVGNVWTKKYIADVDGTNLVSWQWVETRDLDNSQPIIKTAIDDAGDEVDEGRLLVKYTDIATTITTANGVYTKVFQDPVSDLVAWEVEQVKRTQNELNSYEISIPDLIPEEFRAAVPILGAGATYIGTAPVLPSLPPGFLMLRVAQIDFNTYRAESRYRDISSLPIQLVNLENTEEYGGGELGVVMTLWDQQMVPDEGLLVVSSEVRNLGGGLFLRISKALNDTAWPQLLGTHVDEKYGIAIDIERQVVDAGTVGGGSGNVITEVRPIDVWRSIQITSTLDTNSLPSPEVWFSGMRYSFPPVLTDAIIDWAVATCGCSSSFAAILVANLKQYSGPVKTRITEQFYNGAPPDDIVIYQFFPQSHDFGYAWSSFCGDTDGNCTTKSGAPEFNIPLCLHDDIALSIGAFTTWSFPATTPSTLPSGDYIMLPPHVERWRFGVFRRVLTEVLVP